MSNRPTRIATVVTNPGLGRHAGLRRPTVYGARVAVASFWEAIIRHTDLEVEFLVPNTAPAIMSDRVHWS